MLKLIALRINIDAIMAGSVNKSPNAAIIGLVMLSGSHPCSKLLNDTNIVIGSIIKFEIMPAITQISMKSVKSMDGWCSRIHNILDTTAKNKDNTIVKTNDEYILWFSCSENSNFGDIIPMCRLVDSLDANEPNMFPLIPIAPGITTSNPGNVSRKNVILPRMTPAHKSPIAQIKRAINPSLITDLCSSL